MQLPTCTPGRDDTGAVLLSWSALCRQGFYFPNHGLRCQKSGILAKDRGYYSETGGNFAGRIHQPDVQILSCI